MEDAAYSNTMEKLESMKGRVELEGLMHGLASRGWGRIASFDSGEAAWRLEVLNPLDVSLITGWLRAIYCFKNRKQPRISFEEEGAAARFILR
jgi:hypothetical protein